MSDVGKNEEWKSSKAGDPQDVLHLRYPGEPMHKLEKIEQDIPGWGKGWLMTMKMVNDNDNGDH